MLDTLRKSVTGPFVKILIGILILSFAVWGIQDIFGNFKKTVAIEIDDYEVSLDQLVTEYNNQLSIISSQLDKQISLKESLELGIDEIAIENLIRKMVLQIEINKLGIDISEEFVAEQIINDDNFKTDGKFNKARYEQLLSYAGYNDETYVQSEINVNKQNQLFNIICFSKDRPFQLSQFLSSVYAHLKCDDEKISFIVNVLYTFTDKEGDNTSESYKESYDHVIKSYPNVNFIKEKNREINEKRKEPSSLNASLTTSHASILPLYLETTVLI